jgi:hypothetical protein
LTNGFALAFQIGAAITLAAAVVAAVLLRPVERQPDEIPVIDESEALAA